jgi:hypothetical protein
MENVESNAIFYPSITFQSDSGFQVFSCHIPHMNLQKILSWVSLMCVLALVLSPFATAQTIYTTSTFATISGNGPNGVAVDASGGVYVTVGNAIEKVAKGGNPTIFAGNLTLSGSADGATSAARFQGPLGLAFDAIGNLYVADAGNNAIRKIAPSGQVTSLAGLISGYADGVGVAAQFSRPTALTVDKNGNVYVIDSGNGKLRKITQAGATSTIISLAGMVDVAVDEAGTVYVSSVIYEYEGKANPSLSITQIYKIVDSKQSIFREVRSANSNGIPGLLNANGRLAISGRSYFLTAQTTIGTARLFFGSVQDENTESTTIQNFGEPSPVAITVGNSGEIYEAIFGSHSIVTVSPVGTAPSITLQPTGGSIVYGSGVMLSVTASGTPAISYQWLLNGNAITGANQSTYVASAPGTYSVVVTNGAGTVTSKAVDVTTATRLANISTRAATGNEENVVIAGFVIAGPDSSKEEVLIRAVGPGLKQFGVDGSIANPVLNLYDSQGKLVASNTRWNTNSNAAQVAAAARTNGAFSLELNSADSALLVSLSPGAYSAQVAGLNGSTGVALIEVYEVDANSLKSPQIINLSARMLASTGVNVAIAGLVVSGNQPTKMLIRAIGPTLKQFGIGNPLLQPFLRIVDSSGVTIASNVGWSSNANASDISAAAQASGAFALASASADCAILATLAPGLYTAVVAGVGNTSGVCLVEAYRTP